MIVSYLSAFIVSLGISFVLTRVVRDVAVSRGWTLPPSLPRHVHSLPVPTLGGVAIYISFLIVTSFLVISSRFFEIEPSLSLRNYLCIVGSGTVVFLLGLYDDQRSLTPYAKIGVQSIAGGILYLGGIGVSHFRLLFGEHPLGWLGLPLTILWVIGLTNAFNLLDGLDGLAAGSALFSTLTVFVVSLVLGNPLVSLLTVALTGAILGFLRYNFNPATIFLGDSGSMFIGFILSALALTGSQKASTIVAVAIPVVSFGLPILETSLSIVRRFLSGNHLFRGDREHIHHKLLDRGLSHRQAVVTLYGVSAVCGLLSLFLLYPGGGRIGIVLVVLGAGIWLGVQRLGYHEFFELSRAAQRTIEQKRVISNNLAIRRAAERIAKAESLDELIESMKLAFEPSGFDGFQLFLTRVGLGKPPLATSSDGSPLDETCAYEWTRDSLPAGVTPGWSLSLTLIDSSNQKQGVLTLHRKYAGRAILIDVNLVVSDFQTTLSQTIEKLSRRADSTREVARPLVASSVGSTP